jgi:hypothetical protein
MPRRRDFPEELAEGAVTSELFSAVDREKIRELSHPLLPWLDHKPVVGMRLPTN